MCKENGCRIIPVFNNPGETRGIYCYAHKIEGMVNVASKTCIHPECKKQPSYNEEGETKKLYCNAHKLAGMVNVKHGSCNHPGCKIRPSYKKEGEKQKLYCSTHKQQSMTCVRTKNCLQADCNKQPVFNKPCQTIGLYCTSHKLEGMVDVASKTCLQPGCKTQPSYNNKGETRTLYCSAHKLEGMVDVKHDLCKSEWCSTRVQEKYDGYCLFCYINLFPEKPVSRNYKTKEYTVVEYVKTKFPNLNWIADKIVKDGCSKRRPDLLLDLGYQVLIVEVDENQHTDYDCSCQNKRVMELSQDLGHRPIVFIRFNPDKYKKGEITITSCWGQNKNGICVIKKLKTNEWIERLMMLEQQIKYWLIPENTTIKTIETIHLYYDDNW